MILENNIKNLVLFKISIIQKICVLLKKGLILNNLWISIFMDFYIYGFLKKYDE